MNSDKIKKNGEIHPTLTGFDFRVDERLRPMKAIRMKCLECSSRQTSVIRNCEMFDCTLWPYRMGKRGGLANPENDDVEDDDELEGDEDISEEDENNDIEPKEIVLKQI